MSTTPADHDLLTRQALATAAALLNAASTGDRWALRRLLKTVRTEPGCSPDLNTVLNAAAIRYGCTVDQILGGTRARDITNARMVVCYVAHRDLGMSTTRIGQQIDRDHSTVVNAVHRVEADERMRTVARDIAGQLGWEREAVS